MDSNILRRLGALSVLATAALLLTGPAHAEKADREKNINWQGDSVNGNTGTKETDLSGNVIVTQGTLTIHADRIKLHQNADSSVSATAYGNPVSFREKRDGVDEYYEGFAQRIVYDGSKRFVELFDRALLKKSGDEIRSNYISYNAETNILKAEGRPDAKSASPSDAGLGSRVRGVFLPQPKEGTADATAKKTASPGNPSAPLKSDSTLNAAPSK